MGKKEITLDYALKKLAEHYDEFLEMPDFLMGKRSSIKGQTFSIRNPIKDEETAVLASALGFISEGNECRIAEDVLIDLGVKANIIYSCHTLCQKGFITDTGEKDEYGFPAYSFDEEQVGKMEKALHAAHIEH